MFWEIVDNDGEQLGLFVNEKEAWFQFGASKPGVCLVICADDFLDGSIVPGDVLYEYIRSEDDFLLIEDVVCGYCGGDITTEEILDYQGVCGLCYEGGE